MELSFVLHSCALQPCSPHALSPTLCTQKLFALSLLRFVFCLLYLFLSFYTLPVYISEKFLSNEIFPLRRGKSKEQKNNSSVHFSSIHFLSPFSFLHLLTQKFILSIKHLKFYFCSKRNFPPSNGLQIKGTFQHERAYII